MNTTNTVPFVNKSAPRKPFGLNILIVGILSLLLLWLLYRAVSPLMLKSDHSIELIRGSSEPKLWVTVRARDYWSRYDANRLFEQAMASLKQSGWTTELYVLAKVKTSGTGTEICEGVLNPPGHLNITIKNGKITQCQEYRPFADGKYSFEFIVGEFGDSLGYEMKAVYQDGYEAADPPGMGYRPGPHIDMNLRGQRYYWREATRTLHEVRGLTSNYRLEDQEAAHIVLQTDITNLLAVLAEKRQPAK